MILVRPRAWWFNKVPLSILLVLLLIDGERLTYPTVMAMAAVVAIVCCVANYGYALNELFDLDEDRRGGRANVAATVSRARMWGIIVLSAGSAMVLAALLAGTAGSALTAGELLLPLAYSIPPLRVKERGWLGVLSDAAAAHLYPAMLALVVVQHWSIRTYAPLFVLTVATWALATGLRGILSHQLQSEEHDRATSAATVVHQYSHETIERLVVFGMLPIEVLAFCATIMQSQATALFKTAWLAFMLYEFLKFKLNPFPVVVFRREGQPYLPFVDEGFYKAWGPLALTLDASLADPRYLIFAPIYALFLRPRLVMEWAQIRATAAVASRRIANLFVGSGG
jgi:4-hydroxybenzoate polyprenyltransferase